MKNRMKAITRLGFCSFLLILSCSGNQNSDLSVSVIPKNPFLIPTGGATTIGGTSITPPYFLLSEIILQYAGSGGVMIFDIQVRQTGGVPGGTVSTPGLPSTGTTSGGTTSYLCDINGDILRAAFPTLPTLGGQILLQKSNGAVGSIIVACQGLTVPNPPPNSFNYPMTVTVFGATVSNPADPTTIGGRVQATESILVQ